MALWKGVTRSVSVVLMLTRGEERRAVTISWCPQQQAWLRAVSPS